MLSNLLVILNDYRAVLMDSPGQKKVVHMGLPLIHVLQNTIR